jgi:hypothetical protein
LMSQTCTAKMYRRSWGWNFLSPTITSHGESKQYPILLVQ